MRIAQHLLWLGIVFTSVASSATLLPGETLVIHFTTNPSLFGGASPDILIFGFGAGATAEGPAFNITSKLFDGTTQLGTYSYSSSGFDQRRPWYDAMFESTTSPWLGIGFPVVPVDFSTILNGTVQGRLEVTIDSGELSNLDLSYCDWRTGCTFGPVNLFVWQSQGPNSASGLPAWREYNATITGVQQGAVPEPATALLVLPVLAAVAWRRRRVWRDRA